MSKHIITHGETASTYHGFTAYNPMKSIPFRDGHETWLVIVHEGTEIEAVWIVQLGPKINGFNGLKQYYREMYGWDKVPLHRIKLVKDDQEQVHL